jgi:glycosyltransferase involved in cell wall biosynthesis
MEVGIGVPAYNAERYLPATLDHILAQTFEHWEAVVVDDGSRDGTRAVAETYAAKDGRIRLLSQTNKGVSEARNTAFREFGKKDAVIFLDADDLWDADALASLVHALEQSPEVVGAHGMGRYIDENGERFAEGDLEEWCLEPRRAVAKRMGGLREDRTTLAVIAWRVNIPTAGAVLIRREAAEKVGPWDPEYSGAADVDYWYRLTSLGDFAFVNRPIISYRKTQSSMSANSRGMADELSRCRRKALDANYLSDEQKQLLRRCYLDHQRTMRDRFLAQAGEALRGGDAGGAVRNLVSFAKKAAICGTKQIV